MSRTSLILLVGAILVAAALAALIDRATGEANVNGGGLAVLVVLGAVIVAAGRHGGRR